jgi:hypothetical protein
VAFSPASQAFDNAGAGIMRDPAVAKFDFSIAKNVNVMKVATSSSEPSFSMAFNHSSFGPPISDGKRRRFGQILSAIECPPFNLDSNSISESRS